MAHPRQKPKEKFGARVFLMDTDVTLVLQTIKSGSGYTDRYIVDQKPTGQGQRFVDLAGDMAVASAVRDALHGKL